MGTENPHNVPHMNGQGRVACMDCQLFGAVGPTLSPIYRPGTTGVHSRALLLISTCARSYRVHFKYKPIHIFPQLPDVSAELVSDLSLLQVSPQRCNLKTYVFLGIQVTITILRIASA